MEERLLKLLDIEQLSSSKFADVIGVQRSSISHILSGRNKPSFDFLQKTLKAFPHLNADWLILGEGKMYEDDRGTSAGSLFDQTPPEPVRKEPEVTIPDEKEPVLPSSEAPSPEEIAIQSEAAPLNEVVEEEKSRSPKSDRTVTKVILFYDDNSFHSYEPKN